MKKKILKFLTRTLGPLVFIRATFVKQWSFQQPSESHTLPLSGKPQLCSDGCSRLQYFLFSLFTVSNKCLPCFLLPYCSQRVHSHEWKKSLWMLMGLLDYLFLLRLFLLSSKVNNSSTSLSSDIPISYLSVCLFSFWVLGSGCFFLTSLLIYLWITSSILFYCFFPLKVSVLLITQS